MVAPLEFITAAGENAQRAMYPRHSIIAHEMRDIRIDSNCAPTVDIAKTETHSFLRNRC